jgi:hypothetical protein
MVTSRYLTFTPSPRFMASSIVVASESGNQQNSPALPVHIGEARPQIGGVWSGRTIRAHIEEIQTARVGRRYIDTSFFMCNSCSAKTVIGLLAKIGVLSIPLRSYSCACSRVRARGITRTLRKSYGTSSKPKKTALWHGQTAK